MGEMSHAEEIAEVNVVGSDVSVDNINFRGKKGSALVASGIAAVVGIFVALLFLAIYYIVTSNNLQVAQQRDFTLNTTCQVFVAEQQANANIIASVVSRGRSSTQLAAIKRDYDFAVSRQLEQRLGVTGYKIINPNGTLDCYLYTKFLSSASTSFGN
jgi:hypothetical protein